MSEPNQSLEEFLFETALVKSSDAERAAFLDGVCRDDPALRARLDVLLEGHFQAEGFLTADEKKVEKKSPPQPPEDESASTFIGRYKLLEKIGEGGFGEVWMVEQKEPVKRRVALKIIKLGMDTKQVVARFEAERQALAMMDHPNIAKVFDGGATDTGRPYFVMELVRGTRVTEYCGQNQLAIHERLKLFMQICQAIQHAHQKGIIHRDIKPSNILVTLHDGVPVPKVIDFGIAKATQQELTEKTIFTQFRQFIGTPAYISPEQAEMSGLDIDTRSDIYSLGVLLYELLTGTTPFDTKELLQSGLDGMRRIIRQREPVRPSTRIRQTSAVASSPASSLISRHSSLPADLDWIVMKCLQKDRTRRYETANGLARDIERHLSHEPVVARPPSKLYEFQKTVRRHWVGFAATAATIAVLATGVVISSLEAVRARRTSERAQAAEAAETKLRQQAQAQELAARQKAYASDMNQVQQALANNNLGLAQDLLNRQRPGPGQSDLRGWEWRYLWQQSRSGAAYTLCQKSNEIYGLVTSPDGRWLVIGERDQPALYIWDLPARQEIARLPAAVAPAYDVSPKQPLVAYNETHGTGTTNAYDDVVLWNIVTRQKICEVPLDELCAGIWFGSDGKTLGILSGTFANLTVSILRVPDLSHEVSWHGLKTLYGGDPGAATIFNPDLSLFAYSDPDTSRGEIHLLDTTTGKERWRVDAANQPIRTLAFSPDGKVLASGEGFGASRLQLWDVATGRRLGIGEGHSGWIIALAFWPDGKTLASGSSDQTIRLWDVSDPATLRLKRTLRGHRAEVWSLAIVNNTPLLLSGSKDGLMLCWDTSVEPTKQSHVVLPRKSDFWRFGSDDSAITVSDEPPDFLMTEWKSPDFQTPGAQWRHPMQAMVTHDGDIVAGGQFAVVLGTNGMVGVWDWRRGRKIREFSIGTTNINFQGFLQKSRRLVTLGISDGAVSAWNIDTGQRTSLGQVNTEAIRTTPFGYRGYLAANEQWFIFPQGKNKFLIRNLMNNQEMLADCNLREPFADDWPLDSGFSPDGRLFALGSNLGYVKVWDVASWREVATLGGFLQGANCVAFSPDGRRIAVGGGEREAVKLFDVESHEELLNLSAKGGLFTSIAFSDDGDVLGACNQAGDLNLWRAASWEEIAAAEKADMR